MLEILIIIVILLTLVSLYFNYQNSPNSNSNDTDALNKSLLKFQSSIDEKIKFIHASVVQ